MKWKVTFANPIHMADFPNINGMEPGLIVRRLGPAEFELEGEGQPVIFGATIEEFADASA
jgi:hypothetical protein